MNKFCTVRFDFALIFGFLFLFVTLVITTVSFAQRSIYTNQQHFGIEDGLPQSFITGFAQDKDGFIWVSTLDGLSRYDGRGFRNFRHISGDSNSLAQNAIFKMVQNADRDQLTLIYEGLLFDCFNTTTFKASRITNLETLDKIPKIKSQFINNANVYNGTDWLFMSTSSQGIGWRNINTGNTYFANTANRSLKQDTLSTFFQASDGSTFLISEDGVQVSNKTKTKFSFIRFRTLVKRLPPEIFREPRVNSGSVALLPGNRLLICRLGQVVILDLIKKTSKAIAIPTGPSVPYYGYEDLLCQDSKGMVYLVNKGRVFKVNRYDQLELIWQNTTAPEFNITALFVDRSDVLWLSVNARGITKVDLRAMPFYSHPYKKAFVADVLTEAGILPSLIPPAWATPSVAYFFRQARDRKGRLYLSANSYGVDAIFSYDGTNFQKFNHLLSKKIYTALVTKPDGGIRIFDHVNSRWFQWKTPSSRPDSISLDRSQLDKVDIADAYYHKGSMWLSTYSTGLLHYKGNKLVGQFLGKQPGSAGYMPKELTEICPDPIDENLLWIGSRGSGLILWDVNKGLQKIVTQEDGLPNNTVYCILPDKTGKLWCSTNKGIFRLDPKTKIIHTFEKSDGLQGNEFNRAHKFRFPDGRLAFGGTEGYTLFDPAEFEGNNPVTPVPIQMTSLQINNKVQIPFDPGSVVQVPLSLLNEVNLPYNQNHLRFEFAALLFNQPVKLKYRFQLVGIDNQWVENGNSNVASYVDLSPGSYKLLVNATDNRGLWSENVKEIGIVIRPPFWASIWAYLFYVLIFVFLVHRYFSFREKRMRMEQNLSFEKREALRLKEMDELKDRFFSNVTHEFRTPLTLIISPLDKLLSDGSVTGGPLQQTLQGIQKNSRQLLALINEFLDFSKLSNGQMQINLSSGGLALFVENYVKTFQAAAHDKKVALSFIATNVEGLFLFDQDKWSKIIINLVGNALKFTPEKGSIVVSLQEVAVGKVMLEVWDNGPGIAIDQQEKIFERFYQGESSIIRSHGGTGIGLSFVREMAEFMGGWVTVESKPGAYSRFTVELPVQRAELPDSSLVATSSGSSKVISGSFPVNLDKKQPQVLVVEDNEELLSFIMKCLQEKYQVTGAANGLVAWDVIRTNLPDVVISDVMMPGRDGFDLCHLCKSDPLTAHIGFILLTSKAKHEARLKGFEVGADEYITKPFQMDELELRILNLFQLQQNVRVQLRQQLLGNTQNMAPKVIDPFLTRLYQEIDSRISDVDLTVDDLCEPLSVSRSTLNRKLKSLLETSAKDFIRQYRLSRAASLITSGLDIATASYRVGFSSPSYFTQCFKEQYGITPSEYVSKQN